MKLLLLLMLASPAAAQSISTEMANDIARLQYLQRQQADSEQIEQLRERVAQQAQALQPRLTPSQLREMERQHALMAGRRNKQESKSVSR